VLDDGRLTDNQGRTVDFRNTILIMTSNIASTLLLEGIGPDGLLDVRVRDRVFEELRRHFRPEFLNRVDETVLFTPLRRDEIGRIVDLQVARLQKRLEERNILLELRDVAKAFIADAGYDPVYGARPLKRYVQQHVETPLSRKIIAGEVREGQRVVVELETDDKLVFFVY